MTVHIENICLPTLLSILLINAHFIINLINKQYSNSIKYLICGIIYTIIINLFCRNNYLKISWFLLVLPIIIVMIFSILLVTIYKKSVNEVNELNKNEKK